MSERFSNELLNAYVDGELDAEHRQEIEQAMERDQVLRERVEELLSLKQLLQRAYADESPSRPAVAPRSGWKPARLAVAASAAAFMLGAAVTWGVLSYTGGPAGAGGAQLAGANTGPAAQADQAVKVVFHLNRNSPERLREILNEAQALLNASQQGDEPASVLVIASGSGLELFDRGGAVEAARRIKELKRQYSGQLLFNGCGVAYEQLKNSPSNQDFRLMPEVELVDLGMLELMRRQRDGWAYIRL